MARKIKLNGHFSKSLAEVFDDFVVSQTAKGLSDITLTSYRHHLHSISNHLDIQKPMDTLTRKDLEAMVVSMRASGLAHNSISSYCRVLRTFLNWCKRGGMNIPELPNIKDKETVKETYTDAELLVCGVVPDCSPHGRGTFSPPHALTFRLLCDKIMRLSCQTRQKFHVLEYSLWFFPV